MPERKDSDSRKLLLRLRETLAAPGGGQHRLDQITHHIADSMGSQVCSIYLFRDAETLELCATEGLKPESVHKTRLRLGEGLVGRVARTGRHMNTATPTTVEITRGSRIENCSAAEPLLGAGMGGAARISTIAKN